MGVDGAVVQGARQGSPAVEVKLKKCPCQWLVKPVRDAHIAGCLNKEVSK